MENTGERFSARSEDAAALFLDLSGEDTGPPATRGIQLEASGWTDIVGDTAAPSPPHMASGEGSWNPPLGSLALPPPSPPAASVAEPFMSRGV